MNSTMLTRPSLTGTDPGVSNNVLPSLLNSFRIIAVPDRVAFHVQPDHHYDPVEFSNFCLFISRCIDDSLANNEVPVKARDLPKLLKQICQQKNQHLLRAAIMVLMISVKHACKQEWFHPKDSEDLLTIFDEMGKSYRAIVDVDVGSSHYQSTISTIMERFYPKLKMEQILASLEIKPGYGVFATDFCITKNTALSPQAKIWLFVAEIGNIETSACIITPQQVSFLLNGKGVDKRTNVLMDPGPQMPTIVTGMLKYGTNLLQVIGQFNGHYLILVAFMSHKTLPENPVLPDYVQPSVTSFDSDSDIIEGPSQISLNCPISFTRLKTPVKGPSCKHYQCFDFDNFIKINSRRPSWRCPHCNQYVCYVDICVDRHMVEVLKSVGDNVSEVVISADGCWKAVYKDDNDVDKIQNDAHNCGKEPAEPKESTCSRQIFNDDGNLEMLDAGETNDRKPQPADLQSQSTTPILTSIGMNSAGVNRDVAAQVEDDFWSGVQVAFGGLDTPVVAGNFEHPVLTEAISQTSSQEAVDHGITLPSNSSVQNQFSAPNNFQMLQSNYLNSAVNEHGRLQRRPTHVTRNPVVVQALPAQSQTLGPQRISRANLSPGSSTVAPHVSVSSPANRFGPILSDTAAQQLFSRPTMNLPQLVHPVLTDAISQTSSHEAVDHGITLPSNSSVQNHFSAPNNFQMLQSKYLNSAVNEHGRLQRRPTHVYRNPVVVQALPAQSQTLGPQQRSRANLSPGSSTVAPHVSVSSPANCFGPILSDTETQQLFSGPTMNRPQLVGVTLSVSQHHSTTQSQAPQMPNVSAPSRWLYPYYTSSFLNKFENAHLQQALNPRSQLIGQSSSAVHSSGSQIPLDGLRSGVDQAAGTPGSGQPARDMDAGPVARQPAPSPIQNQTPREQGGIVRGPSQSTSRLDGSFNLQSQSDWRPTGRMRGSLANRQYSDAVRQLIIEPTQSVQSARPLGPQ